MDLDDVRCLWALHMWRSNAKLRRKNSSIKTQLHALSNDLAVLGAATRNEPADGSPACTQDGSEIAGGLSNGGEACTENPVPLNDRPVSCNGHPVPLNDRPVSCNGHPVSQNDNSSIDDVDALRGRIVDLEKAVTELLDSNHRLRLENSDAEQGLGKALDLLRSQKREKNTQRQHEVQCAINLADNARTFWAVDIPHVDADIDPARFYRDFVVPSRPCILCANMPNSRARSLNWIQEQCGDNIVSVNCTPDGLADAVSEGTFVKPLQEKIAFSTFLERLHARSSEDVVYVSEQNDSLRREFPQLFQPPPLASAFSEHPLDAVNFWLGDERSYTSFHKDHYENVYSVLCGTKVFWLAPPTSAWCMYEKMFPAATWTGGPGKWSLATESEKVPWIPVDARSWTSEDYRKSFPDFAHAGMQRVEIQEGESLYLPSLWYHAASQLGIMAAINYWFDMRFDNKWVYYQYLREVNRLP